MWRNVCNGCQYMPQVSSGHDGLSGWRDTKHRLHPDACGKFFRQHTERAASASTFIFMRHSEDLNMLCCSQFGLSGSRKRGTFHTCSALVATCGWTLVMGSVQERNAVSVAIMGLFYAWGDGGGAESSCTSLKSSSLVCPLCLGQHRVCVCVGWVGGSR